MLLGEHLRDLLGVHLFRLKVAVRRKKIMKKTQKIVLLPRTVVQVRVMVLVQTVQVTELGRGEDQMSRIY